MPEMLAQLGLYVGGLADLDPPPRIGQPIDARGRRRILVDHHRGERAVAVILEWHYLASPGRSVRGSATVGGVQRRWRAFAARESTRGSAAQPRAG